MTEIEVIAVRGRKVEIKEGNEVDTVSFKQFNDMLETGLKYNVKFVYDEDNKELEEEIKYLSEGYYEIAEPLEADEKDYQIYYHEVMVKDGEIEYDLDGEYVKTYKTLKGATNFVESH